LQLAGVLDQHYAVVCLCDFGQNRIGQGGLAGRCAARDKDVLAGGDRVAEASGLAVRHDLCPDIIGESEDRDGGFADRETRRGHDRRQQALEALAALGKFGGNTRCACMHLGPDMMRDQPDDAFAIGGRQALIGCGKARRQAVDPEPSIGIKHDLDDLVVLEKPGDVRAEGSAEHAAAA
jgi:hypothetical protein